MKVIVAESLLQARNTAEIDWGWRAIARNRWIDDAGEEVHYCSKLHQLFGSAYGSVTIYLGYRWWENRDLRGLEEYAQATNQTLISGVTRPGHRPGS